VQALLAAGVDDWGGISPGITQDWVNPEREWPSIESLRLATERSWFRLVARLPSYPRYVAEPIASGGMSGGAGAQAGGEQASGEQASGRQASSGPSGTAGGQAHGAPFSCHNQGPGLIKVQGGHLTIHLPVPRG
jgi:hypothetical protein